MLPARHPIPPYATVVYLNDLRIQFISRFTRQRPTPVTPFERVPAASTPWGMARYRQRQPPARFANIAESDYYPTGKAPALPGRTGEFGDG